MQSSGNVSAVNSFKQYRPDALQNEGSGGFTVHVFTHVA